jgi:hypothetical protein
MQEEYLAAAGLAAGWGNEGMSHTARVSGNRNIKSKH